MEGSRTQLGSPGDPAPVLKTGEPTGTHPLPRIKDTKEAIDVQDGIQNGVVPQWFCLLMLGDSLYVSVIPLAFASFSTYNDKKYRLRGIDDHPPCHFFPTKFQEK